jgi:hypothetical protein
VIDFELPADETLSILAGEVYGSGQGEQAFFHGPAYQVIGRARVAGDTAIALMASDLGPNTEPADVESLMAPRQVELCFQAAALWHIRTHDAMAFPLGIGSVAAYPASRTAVAGDRRLYCICRTADGGDTFDAQVVDEAGNVCVDLRGYRTVSRPGVSEV